MKLKPNLFSVAAYAATGSLLSRASTFIVLIIAARRLTVGDVGIFATCLGASIAAAYVLSNAGGTVVAYWVRASPARGKRAAGLLAAPVALSALVGLWATFGGAGTGTLAICAGAVSVFIANAAGALTMQLLRGADRLGAGVTTAYTGPAVLRVCVSLIAVGPSVSSMLGASACAAAIAAGYGILVLVTLQNPSATPEHDYALGASLSIATLSIGLMWFVLGQADLVSLNLFRSSHEAGEYAPMMRAFEATTAIGVALSLTGITSLAGRDGRDAADYVRTMIPKAIAAYLCLAIPLLTVGRPILSALLGYSVAWPWLGVIALAAGFGANVLTAVCFEALASQRAAAHILAASLTTLATAMLLIPALVAGFGTAGAATGTGISYLIGFGVAMTALRRLSSTPVRTSSSAIGSV